MAELTSIESPFAARKIPLNATIANIPAEIAELNASSCDLKVAS
jgi:hypothetical protein